MICISISNVSQLGSVIEKGAELLELRLDLIGSSPLDLYAEIPAGIKTVVTCRQGKFIEKERIRLLSESIKLGASYVDLELESSEAFAGAVIKVAERESCDVIFSYHDFNSTPDPEKLRNTLERCYKRGGVIAKVATKVRSRKDVINLLSLHSQSGRKVVLGMGNKGRITRVAAPLLGSEFTFASPGDGVETAPGQMSVEQLSAIYKILNGS